LHTDKKLVRHLLAKNRDTAADFLAFSGSPAPSKFPTLIPAAVPIPYGICKIYYQKELGVGDLNNVY